MRDSRGSAGKKPAKNSHAGASAGARIENLVRETAQFSHFKHCDSRAFSQGVGMRE